MPNHPDSERKVVVKRRIKVVPEIISPRLPGLTMIKQDDYELYLKIMIVFFKSHRLKFVKQTSKTGFSVEYEKFKCTEHFMKTGASNFAFNTQQ